MAHNLIHRGLAKKNFKENTLKAFKYCFSKKYGIETDLHCTKDNEIVCFHDFNLEKKFKTNKLIKNLTFNEIKYFGINRKIIQYIFSILLIISKIFDKQICTNHTWYNSFTQ